jgi:nucleotide-binding universal stress UspA family protein
METPRTEPTRPILVAVDFSPHSEAALLWAARASERFQAPLLVLHVVHDPESAPGYYQPNDQEGHVQRLEEAAATMMAEFAERIRERHPELEALQKLETKLAVGLPANRILEVAEKSNACLIVMGSQGRTGLAHLLLGSKAERVVQLSPIPVTIVKLPVKHNG